MLVSSINNAHYGVLVSKKQVKGEDAQSNIKVPSFKSLKGIAIGGVSAGLLGAVLTLNNSFENNVAMQLAITVAGALTGNKAEENLKEDKSVKNNTTNLDIEA